METKTQTPATIKNKRRTLSRFRIFSRVIGKFKTATVGNDLPKSKSSYKTLDPNNGVKMVTESPDSLYPCKHILAAGLISFKVRNNKNEWKKRFCIMTAQQINVYLKEDKDTLSDIKFKIMTNKISNVKAAMFSKKGMTIKLREEVGNKIFKSFILYFDSVREGRAWVNLLHNKSSTGSEIPHDTLKLSTKCDPFISELTIRNRRYDSESSVECEFKQDHEMQERESSKTCKYNRVKSINSSNEPLKFKARLKHNQLLVEQLIIDFHRFKFVIIFPTLMALLLRKYFYLPLVMLIFLMNVIVFVCLFGFLLKTTNSLRIETKELIDLANKFKVSESSNGTKNRQGDDSLSSITKVSSLTAVSGSVRFEEVRKVEEAKYSQFCFGHSRSNHKAKPISASHFKVRCGTDYHRNKQKKPARNPTIYEVFATDYFSPAQNIHNIMTKFSLPPIPKDQLAKCKSKKIPYFFITHMKVALNEPNLFLQENVKFSSLVHFHRVRFDMLSRYVNDQDVTGAMKLYQRFIANFKSESSMRKRFKAISLVENFDDFKAIRKLKSFNGKPFILNTSVTFRKLDEDYRYFLVEIDISKFRFVARKLMHKFFPLLPQVKLLVAITIQAEENEEMPEGLLLATRITNLDVYEKTIPITS